MIQRLFLVPPRDGIFDQPQLRAEIPAGHFVRQQHQLPRFFGVAAHISDITQQANGNRIQAPPRSDCFAIASTLARVAGSCFAANISSALRDNAKRMVRHILQRNIRVTIPRNVGHRVNEGKPGEIGRDDHMTVVFIQKSGGFARNAANRAGPLRFLDIGSRVSF